MRRYRTVLRTPPLGRTSWWRTGMPWRGIGPTTPNPAGGIIERDDAGMPTGVLRETAQALIKRRRPGPEPDLVRRLRSELQRCAARGATTIHDIVKSEREIQAYLELERAGQLPVRVQLIPRVVQAEFEPWSFLDAEALGRSTEIS